LLSRFVTIDGSLLLGLATSPAIANVLCLPIDKELSELVQKLEATYSRYADDISFSSNENIPDIETIKLCLQKNKFELAESKTRKSKLGQSHYVTGLSVSDKFQPHAPRSKKRNLRQQLYYCKKFGLDDHLRRLGNSDSQPTQMAINHIDGMVKYIAFHEPRLSSQLKSAWTDILKQSGSRPSFAPKNQDRTSFHIYIDEAEFVRPNGIRLLALGLSVSQHQNKINLATEMRLEKTTSDIWVAGNRNAIIERGLHFTDATEDMKLAYVEQLQLLPFEGYVAIVELPSPASYEAKYLELLNSVIRRRLMATESKAAYLVFEINSKVSETLVRNCAQVAYEYLEDSNPSSESLLC
jgi:RNA-directed DNA polymerase